MYIRTKDGAVPVENRWALLEFLRGASGKGGRVREDIELVTPVPLRMNNEEGKMNNEGIAWTLSTFDLDRFSERIDPAGWDYKRYMDNPVIEWAHRYDIPAIGKADGLYADEKGLHGVIVFNEKDYDPFGWAIGQRVKAGVIRAGSVGFRVIEVEIPERGKSREQGEKSKEEETLLIFRKQELLEFSICNVPANPFALAKSANVEKAEPTQDLTRPTYWGGLINNL
jgi:HK97 family phage prohead protease